MLRSGWPDAESFDGASYLAQQAGFHSRTHKQADDLSFIWYDRGTEILIDAGRYGYLGKTEPGSDLWNKGFWYSDPKRIYVESTRSHNTVEIDGMSFNRKDSPPYGSAIQRWGETEDGLLFVETHATQFETIGHTRLLVFDPGNWLLVYDCSLTKPKKTTTTASGSTSRPISQSRVKTANCACPESLWTRI